MSTRKPVSPSGLSRRGVLGTALAAGAVTTMSAVARGEQSDVDTGPAPAQRDEQTANGRLYELVYGNQRAVVAGVSATLLSWRVDDEELLLTHEADDVGEGYQGKTILPWCNRIDHGRYTFGGQQYQVPINEPERDTALHGLLSFTEWELVRHRRSNVILRTQQHPTYGYPFHLAFEIEFALTGDGVSSTLTAHNVGSDLAPLATATHTYIAAASGTIDTMELELGADTYYLVNDRLIPTGSAPVAGTEYDFRNARPIEQTEMDTAFTDVHRGSDGLAWLGLTRPGGHDVRMWMDASYGYLQVYTDDDSEGHMARSGVAVEPVSCAPDCFNNGDGLVVLEPGQTWRGAFGLRAG